MKIRASIILYFMLMYWQFSLWSQTGSQQIIVATGSTVTLTASTVSGVSYQWFRNNLMIQGAQEVQYLAKLPGIYTVVGFNVHDCPSPRSPEVKIIFSDAAPPFYDTLQVFCHYPVPVVADLVISGQNIKWYDAVSAIELSINTPLQDHASYYATQTIGGVESVPGNPVLVKIKSVLLPTTSYSTQYFCKGSNPIISDIQVSENNIKWYDQPTAGNSLSETIPLQDRMIYYASKIDTEHGTSCESEMRLAVAVLLLNNTTTPIMVSGKNVVCTDEEVVYRTVSGMKDYSWLIEGGIVVEGGKSNNDFVKVLWGDKDQGRVSVSYTDAATCNKNDVGILDVRIGVCSDLIVGIEVNNVRPFIEDIVTFTITVQNQGAGFFKDIVIRENLPNGFAFVNSKISEGSYDEMSRLWNIPVLEKYRTARLTISARVLRYKDYDNKYYLNTVDLESSSPQDINLVNNHAEVQTIPECILVYNGFSPDKNGINDFFRIDCIEKYPGNVLEIFDRYGGLVYSIKDYKNDWDGVANVSNTVDRGTILPLGTYYYILTLGDGSKPKVGWIYISR